MKIRDVLRERKRGFSFEVFPPKSAEGREAIVRFVKEFSLFDPLYASVSYGAGGTSREGTFLLLKLLREQTTLPLMSHLTGIGETSESMDSVLRTLQSIGIDNILALRGDTPKSRPDLDPEKGPFPHAVDLVKFIKQYNVFSIAVAVYPEGHRLSQSIDQDLEYAKQKIDAGADFCITQMFFDNRHYYEFRERAAQQGITVPILPGIMPIIDCRKMVQFAAACNTRIPQEILDRMEPYLDMPEDMRKLGVQFATEQTRDLISNGVPYIHFYSMNQPDSLRRILEGAGIQPQKKTRAA